MHSPHPVYRQAPDAAWTSVTPHAELSRVKVGKNA